MNEEKLKYPFTRFVIVGDTIVERTYIKESCYDGHSIDSDGWSVRNSCLGFKTKNEAIDKYTEILQRRLNYAQKEVDNLQKKLYDAAMMKECWYCGQAGHSDNPCQKRVEDANRFAAKGAEIYSKLINTDNMKTNQTETDNFPGLRWSVAVGSQPPFACYVDYIDEIDDNTWIRYNTTDGNAVGWREAKDLRPLSTESDWKAFKQALLDHKIMMAKLLIEQNSLL